MLWTAFAIGAFGLGMSAQANFLVPIRAHELGASFEIIGLIVGAGALSPAIFSVPMGKVIDRLGARRSFILGTGLSGCVGLSFILVTNYWVMLGLQLLLGLTRILGWVASQSYITSLGRPEDRPTLTGKFSFFSNVGPMIGPLLAGGVAQLIGFRFTFFFIAGYAFTFALMGWLLVETGRAANSRVQSRGAGFKAAVQLLRIRGIQVAMLFTFVRLWIEWAWTSFFPVYLVDTGVAAGIAGTVVFARSLAATLLAPTTGYWTRFMDKQTLCGLGLAVGAAGFLLSPHIVALPFVYLAPLMIGVGTGLSLPLLLSIVSDVAPDDQRGIALGLRVSVNQMAAAAAPPLVGPLVATFGLAVAFAFGGGIAFALLGCAFVLLHRLNGPRDERPRHDRAT